MGPAQHLAGSALGKIRNSLVLGVSLEAPCPPSAAPEQNWGRSFHPALAGAAPALGANCSSLLFILIIN